MLFGEGRAELGGGVVAAQSGPALGGQVNGGARSPGGINTKIDFRLPSDPKLLTNGKRRQRFFFFYFWGLKSRYIFTPVNQQDFTSNLLRIIVGLTKLLLDKQLDLPEATQQKVERAK